jgi:hypothetical protein
MTTSVMPFVIETEVELEPGLYKPVPPNPSGLRMAWVLFGIALLIGAYLLFFNFDLPIVFWLASALLLFVALAISFSHWLEGHTTITLSESGVRYESPIRKVAFNWSEIEELWCGKIRGGWRYMVSCKNAAFRFQSLVVIRAGSGREVRTGFREGQKIAQFLYQAAELIEFERQDNIWVYRKGS